MLLFSGLFCLYNRSLLTLWHISGKDGLLLAGPNNKKKKTGKDGLLLAGPNALILEPLVLYYVSLLAREVFIGNYFMRVFVLVDTLTKIRQVLVGLFCLYSRPLLPL